MRAPDEQQAQQYFNARFPGNTERQVFLFQTHNRGLGHNPTLSLALLNNGELWYWDMFHGGGFWSCFCNIDDDRARCLLMR
jgi:hypothetical protein